MVHIHFRLVVKFFSPVLSLKNDSLCIVGAFSCIRYQQVHIPQLNHIGLWVDDLKACVTYLKSKVMRPTAKLTSFLIRVALLLAKSFAFITTSAHLFGACRACSAGIHLECAVAYGSLLPGIISSRCLLRECD